MPPNPTLRWERLQDKFYRTIEGYDLQWDVDISSSRLAVCPFGGAIAVTRDFSSIRSVKLGSKAASGDGISIYNGSGILLHSIPWSLKSNGMVRTMEWTSSEHLVVVSSTGVVRCYYDFDGNFRQIPIGKVADDVTVHSAQVVHGDTLVCLLDTAKPQSPATDRPTDRPTDPSHNAQDLNAASPVRKFVVLEHVGGEYSNYSESSYTVDTTTTGDILCWAVQAGGDQRFPLIICTDKAVYQVGRSEGGTRTVVRQAVEICASQISLSPNGELVALYDSAQGKVCVISSDLQLQYSEIKCSTPTELVWCGSDAVAAVYDTELNIIGPHGGSTTIFPVDEDYSLESCRQLACFPEVDGLRILSGAKHDLFCKVPEQVVDIFRLGSTAPGAILRDCVDQIDRQSPQADENLRVISKSLRSAVDACVFAARLEFEPYWQKRLLRAALFGKSAIPSSEPPYDSDEYVETVESLRVLNQVRNLDVGALISYPQYQQLGALGLVDRLLVRKMHMLAFEVCQYLHLPSQPVYADWACAKIKATSASIGSVDQSVEFTIMKRLSETSGIAYEQIARTAFEEGQQDLAIRMVQRDARPSKQIPLLLTMNQNDSALNAAVASRDPSLVCYVLMVLHKRLPLASFFRLINNKPLASACFEDMCRTKDGLEGLGSDSRLLVDFYYQADRRLDTAFNAFKTAVEMSKASSSSFSLSDVQSKIHESQGLFESASGAKSFEVKTCDEFTKVMALHQQLEHDYEQPFVGLSLAQTISQLVKIGQNQRASKVKDTFKISDKQFWWLKLDAIIYRRDWDMLRKFAKSSKSPIGYKPFFTKCLAAGAQKQAVEYIGMSYELSIQEKVDLYLKVGELRKAIQEAFKAKNKDSLHLIRQQSSPAMQEEIDSLLAQLK